MSDCTKEKANERILRNLSTWKAAGWTTAEQSPQEGARTNTEKRQQGRPGHVSLWRRTHFPNRLTQVYTALMWRQRWVTAHSPELLKRWLSSGRGRQARAKGTRGKRRYQGECEGLWRHLGGTQTWALTLGKTLRGWEEPQCVRWASRSELGRGTGGLEQGEGAKTGSCGEEEVLKQVVQRRGIQGGQDEGMEELGLEHAECGANRQLGVGPGGCQRDQGWRWRSEFPIINGR